MPAAQADAGSRNANKAGWRGLLRAGAPGQAGGSRPGGRGLQRGLDSQTGPSLVFLESGLLGRFLSHIMTWPSTASSGLPLGSSSWDRDRGSLDKWFSEVVLGPAASASAGKWLEMKILRPPPQTY